MRVLITGGAGFIGSHLSDALLAQNHQVTVIDDLSTGSIDNVAHLLAHPDFTFHHDTIFNRELLATLVEDSDIVYHLAAAVGVKRIIQLPVETLETNVAGAELVLRLAAENARRIVLASSSEVYGKSTQLPFREDGDLLPVTIARLFNTVGPRQSGRHGMVLPTFVRQALLGETITVYGSGEQSRCFTHVLDIVEGLTTIACHDSTIGEIYNLGSTSEITINQLAQLVLTSTGSHSRIAHLSYEQAYAPGFEDMQRRLPDIRKAREAFNFQPRRNLGQILADTISDLRTRLEQEQYIATPGS